MEVRAALATGAGKPLSIETVQLDGPRAGEVLIEVKATGGKSAIPMPSPSPARTRRGCS